MFCVVCRKQQEKLKKMYGFTETFIQGSDNFKTFAPSDHDESKMHVRAVNEVNISKAQNVASYNVQLQYYCLFHKTLPF